MIDRLTAAVLLCTDVNAFAARATLRTGRQNSVKLDPLIASFADPLLQRLTGQVDLLVFNPPYVPTTPEELQAAKIKASLEGSWAGGSDGMDVTDLFLPAVSTLLSERGAFYLVAVALNKPDSIIERMQRVYNLQGETVLKRRAGREVLSVLRFHR